MARGKQYISFIVKDQNKIIDFIDNLSVDMYEYIKSKSNSKFILFYKYLNHSDLSTFGKATKINMLHKNLLYYISESEMKNIEQRSNKPFETAHQSCIGLQTEWYKLVNLPDPRGKKQYLINDYCNVFVVNSNLEYFKSKYTKIVFEKLNKNIDAMQKSSWDFDNLDINLNISDRFTPIDLHCGVHGLGIKKDIEFHKLRHHLFKGDTFVILFEKTNEFCNMFLLFEKNPIFFTIIGENNKNYEEYLQNIKKRQLANLKIDNIGSLDVVSRKKQKAWRDALAREMMGYSDDGSKIFCPFTFITANYKKQGVLFIASHIKGFSDPNTLDEEKYDINNGLLLSVTADALFDKHFISVNENKELVFSFIFSEERLKDSLLLSSKIFKPILNDKRMKYLKYHYEKFKELEEQRKKEED